MRQPLTSFFDENLFISLVLGSILISSIFWINNISHVFLKIFEYFSSDFFYLRIRRYLTLTMIDIDMPILISVAD